jgi:hypothetical protein
MDDRRWWWLFAALLVLHVAPIWSVAYFPSQDGPSHLYNARLLFDLLDPAHFQLRQLFEYNPALHPNLLPHLLLAPLQLVLPPAAAEKLLASLVVMLLPLSLAYLVRGLRPGHAVFALLGFLFAFHKHLHMGLYAFSLGIPLSLFALGWWWRHREQPTVWSAAVQSALLALLYLTHFMAFAVALLAIVASSAWCALLEARRDPRGAWRGAVLEAGLLLPFLLLGLDYQLRGMGSDYVKWASDDKLHDVFFQQAMLASYTRWHQQLTPWLGGLLALSFLATLWQRARRREWLLPRDVLLLLALAFVVLFFCLPSFFGRAGRINERLYLYAVLFAAAWLGPLPPRLARAIGAALVALSLAHAGRLAVEYRRLQPELAELASGAALVAPHSSVTFVEGEGSLAFPDGIRFVRPFLHMDAYYALGRDVALLTNYEITFGHFPIRAGEAPFEDPDYVVAWRLPEDADELAPYASSHEPIHRAGELRLLRRRAAPPDAAGFEPLPGGGARLRLEAPSELWTPGSRGWLRLLPRLAWPEGATTPQAVGDARDRVFRADVAPGRWRVVLELAAPQRGRFELDVIANDARVAERAAAEAGAAAPVLRFDVDAADGRILLLLHARPRPFFERAERAPWALHAITLERDG